MEFTIVRNLGTKIYAKSNVTVTDEVSVSANNPDWYEEYRFKLKKCYMEKLLAAFEFGNSSIAFTLRGNPDMDLSKEEELFPKTGLIACQGVEGGNSQEACDRLFPHGNILYVNIKPHAIRINTEITCSL